jgi:hypothetical protein
MSAFGGIADIGRIPMSAYDPKRTGEICQNRRSAVAMRAVAVSRPRLDPTNRNVRSLRSIIMRLALSKVVILSQEDVSGENDEAAHGKCRVDADHHPRYPGLEDACGEQRDTNQCCQRNQ